MAIPASLETISNGVDIKTVQHRLGHSRASVTLDFFAHAEESQDRKATELFGNLLAEPEPMGQVINF